MADDRFLSLLEPRKDEVRELLGTPRNSGEGKLDTEFVGANGEHIAHTVANLPDGGNTFEIRAIKTASSYSCGRGTSATNSAKQGRQMELTKAEIKASPPKENAHQCYRVWSARLGKWIGAAHRTDCCYSDSKPDDVKVKSNG